MICRRSPPSAYHLLVTGATEWPNEATSRRGSDEMTGPEGGHARFLQPGPRWFGGKSTMNGPTTGRLGALRGVNREIGTPGGIAERSFFGFRTRTAGAGK